VKLKFNFILVSLFLALVSVCAYAAAPAWDKRIPAGYQLDKEVRGDLNGDGADDYVLITKDGNSRGIMIFFNKGNDYQLVLENRQCFSNAQETSSEFLVPEISFKIGKGNLYIAYLYTNGKQGLTNTYTFRYKNSEFELIDYEDDDPKRATSINFQVKKKLVKNCPESKKCKETWTNIVVKEPILLRNMKLDKLKIDSYIKETAGTFTDTRSGKKYWTVNIGKRTWMAENLNYQPKIGESWCYNKDEANCEKYGRLYDRGTAKKVCPIGWHLPSRDEWDSLAQAVGGSGERSEDGIISWRGAGLTLRAKYDWSEDVGIDGFGFSALPGGRFFNNIAFINAGKEGYWWTATESKDGCTYYRYMFDKWDWVYEGCFSDKEGFSVRCVAA